MSDALEKQLIAGFTAAWNSSASSLLGKPSSLDLLAQREVSGEQMTSTLAVVTTWSAAFAAACHGGLSGAVVFLFKSEDSDAFDRLVKSGGDGGLKPGGRSLVKATLDHTVSQLSSSGRELPSFGAIKYIDLQGNESHLAKIVSDAAWVGTFSLSIGDDVDTQALVLYSSGSTWDPESAVAPKVATAPVAPAPQPASQTQNSGAQQHSTTPSRRAVRVDESSRNIERLLDVELDVIVRFGVTNVPLREIVRMGVGTMVELNRAVDEPVELLVNGRPLARGEVVVVDGYYGVRITEIGTPAERALSLT